jgi:hypothetical protein
MTRLACLLLVLAAAALLGSSAEAARQADLLVTAERLFDGERLIRHGAVAIDGDRVVAVGPRSRIAVTARRVRRFGNATILPGLVDLHAHMLGAGQEASPVTTVRDLAAPVTALPARQRPRAPWVIAAGPFVTRPGGYPAAFFGEQLTYPVRGPIEARAAVRKLVRSGARVIKVGITIRPPNSLLRSSQPSSRRHTPPVSGLPPMSTTSPGRVPLSRQASTSSLTCRAPGRIRD